MIQPETIDWTQMSLWAAGIATVITSVVIAVVRGVRVASSIAKNNTSPPAVHRTDIYTTDSAAFDRLSNNFNSLAARLDEIAQLGREANQLMHEGNLLRREATLERRTLREALDVNTAATDKSVNALENLQTEVRDLIRELIRHK